MEFQISFSLIVIIVATISFLMKLLYIFRKSNSKPKFPPPGPWKIPIIGNLFSIMSRQSPHVVLKNLAIQYGPLMHLQLGEVSAIIVSSPQLAQEILIKNDLAFSNRPELIVAKTVMYNYSDVAFAPYGNYWRQLRKLCTLELLSVKKVKSFSYIREEEAKLMIESIMSSSGSPINLTKKIYTLTNTVISRATFGKIPKDQDLMVRMAQEAGNLAGAFNIADLYPSYKLLHIVTGMSSKITKIHKILDKIYNDIIAEHEKENENTKVSRDKEGLLDILLRLKDSGELEFPLSIDNIKSVLIDVLTAGSDTSSATTEWAMSELIKNPQVLEKVQAEVREVFKGKSSVQEVDFKELKYMNMVIKETMRLHIPGPFLIPRECRKSCEVGGYVIPVKTKVIINAWALGRDPEYWQDPDRFIPERFENTSYDFFSNNFEYLPFGAGRRMCPGVTFGVANVEILLSNLLYHFDWKLPVGMKPDDLDMSESFGIACKRKNNLYLIPTPYTPL